MDGQPNLRQYLSGASSVAASMAAAVRSANGTLSTTLDQICGQRPVLEMYRRPSGTVVVRVKYLWGSYMRESKSCSAVAIASLTRKMITRQVAEEALRRFDESIA